MTTEIASDIKKLLRKQEFPTVAIEAIGQLQKILANFVGMSVPQQVVQVCNEVLEEFVFFEKKRKKLSAIREIQILDLICASFQTCAQESCRNLFFVMFPPTDKRLLDQRMPILTRLISLAVTLKVDTILDCAAFWFHVVGIKTTVSLQLVEYLLRDLFESGTSPCLSHEPALLVNTSPAFCATFVTATTFIYSMRLPPKALLELLATWLEENLYLSYVPLETVMPTAQTFVPGLIRWIVLTDPNSETDASVTNRLHLALLKIILKAPQGIIQVDNFVALFEALEKPSELQIERFVQILQAALTAQCVQGKPEELRRVIEGFPPTKLRDLVLEYNVKDPLQKLS
ncbi:uncharacterized protein C7orf26 homolog [Galendromus occidentalis]|uniref:Uncharacterized protein C7orf26 homolog n=1 Tax=Galendromus occidentalis TaxID=34638 RepID=A0AAJ6QQZ3_9ACAR|nr:uncharacterized protein C7orf26 homolog [Galendromus occidentalis]